MKDPYEMNPKAKYRWIGGGRAPYTSRGRYLKAKKAWDEGRRVFDAMEVIDYQNGRLNEKIARSYMEARATGDKWFFKFLLRLGREGHDF